MTWAETAFIIPVDGDNGILGQILADRIGPNPDLFASFRGVHPIKSFEDKSFVASLLNQPPLMVANSFTVLIENGSWKNLGKHAVAETNQFYPKFKLPFMGPLLAFRSSYDGTKRILVPFPSANIPLRFSISPKLFENLALAANGKGTWDKKFDKVLVEKMSTTGSMTAIF